VTVQDKRERANLLHGFSPWQGQLKSVLGFAWGDMLAGNVSYHG